MIFKEIMHFHYMTINLWSGPGTRTPAPGHEFYSFCIPFMVIIIKYSFSDLYMEVEKNLKEKMLFQYMTYSHALAQENQPRGSWNLQFWQNLSYLSSKYTKIA